MRLEKFSMKSRLLILQEVKIRDLIKGSIAMRISLSTVSLQWMNYSLQILFLGPESVNKYSINSLVMTLFSRVSSNFSMLSFLFSKLISSL